MGRSYRVQYQTRPETLSIGPHCGLASPRRARCRGPRIAPAALATGRGGFASAELLASSVVLGQEEVRADRLDPVGNGLGHRVVQLIERRVCLGTQYGAVRLGFGPDNGPRGFALLAAQGRNRDPETRGRKPRGRRFTALCSEVRSVCASLRRSGGGNS